MIALMGKPGVRVIIIDTTYDTTYEATGCTDQQFVNWQPVPPVPEEPEPPEEAEEKEPPIYPKPMTPPCVIADVPDPIMNWHAWFG